ncbi:MAG: AP2 domain-containing protein [Evtepia sp.]
MWLPRSRKGCAGSDKKEFVSGTQISKIKSIPNKANKTGVVGVNWDKSRNKWQASIRFQRKKIYLGRYDQFEDAVKARKNGENKYFENILKSTD